MNRLTRIMMIGALCCGLLPACSEQGKGHDMKPTAQTPVAPLGGSEGIAVSLRVLQDQARRGENLGKLASLSGMTKVVGYLVDRQNRDVILVGFREAQAPPLHLDDLIVALRNAWLKYAEVKGNTRYYSAPGCSIDPDPAVLGQLRQVSDRAFGKAGGDGTERFDEWHSVCRQPQATRVLGIPDSHMAQVLIDADYLMKRLVDGSVTLPDLPEFRSLTDLTMATAKQDLAAGKKVSVPLSSLNRFWFFPGETSYVEEDRDAVYLKRCAVQLLTEEEYVTTANKVTGKGRPDKLAAEFARNFTVQYHKLAARQPLYHELQQQFTWVALAKLLKEKEAFAAAELDMSYLLESFPLGQVSVSKTLPGISNVKSFKETQETRKGQRVISMFFPSCGGVTIETAPRSVANNGYVGLPETRQAVMNSRPSLVTLAWQFLFG